MFNFRRRKSRIDFAKNFLSEEIKIIKINIRSYEVIQKPGTIGFALLYSFVIPLSLWI